MYATKQLRDEHEGIEVILSVLKRLAGDMEAGQPVEQEHLAAILDFLRTFADRCHHGKEEDLLFPALGDAGLPTQGGPIGVMLHEHELGRAYIRGMAGALDQIRAGKKAGQAFADNALGYVGLLRAHIEKENHVLFVMAERMLPAEEHARLLQEFDRVERERIGPGVHEQFHHLIHSLRGVYLQRVA